MTCNKASEVHRYYDGELSAPERAAIEEHVRACETCRDILADLRNLSSLISAATLTDMPVEALERLYERRHVAQEQGVLRLAGWMTATAAAILLTVLVTRPEGRTEVVSRPAIWESVAVTPSLQETSEANSDLVVLAQWMADDLSAGEGR